MLLVGAVLLLAAGLAFAATPLFIVLLVAATIGVISPSGNEVGPFLAIEQASLTQLVDPTSRTQRLRAVPARGLARDGRRFAGRRARSDGSRRAARPRPRTPTGP